MNAVIKKIDPYGRIKELFSSHGDDKKGIIKLFI